MIGNTNLTIIDSRIFKKKVYMFEFTLRSSEPEIQAYEDVYVFIENYSPLIKIAQNLLIFFHLKNEKAFLENVSNNTTILKLENYSLVCIEQGHIASTWLKQI